MLKSFLIFLLIVNFNYLRAQPNVYNPGSYNCNASAVYKKFYVRPVNLDTVSNPKGMIGERVSRIIDFKDLETKRLFASNKSCDYLDFFEILKFGLITNKIKAYSSSDFFENEKKYRINVEKIQSILSLEDTVTETIFDSDGNSVIEKRFVERQLNSNDLIGFLICEDWYIDKHWAQLEKRIFYICPIYKNEKTQLEYPLFYLHFNDCRDFLSSFKAINLRSKDPISYEQFILRHQYPSFVVKTSNVFNRKINDYKKGTDIIIENDNSLKKLHNSESDLFER